MGEKASARALDETPAGSAVRTAICRGLLRSTRKGTRKTPRERHIVIRYPWGISHKSDGDDALAPVLRLGAGGLRRGERGRRHRTCMNSVQELNAQAGVEASGSE